MGKELKIKKCMKCGAIIEVIEDCNCQCGFECCTEKMVELKPNSVDAAIEKHVPTYEVVGDNVIIKVNHVMEDEHYIEWIKMLTLNKEYTVKFLPNEIAECKLPYASGAKIYAYCNKHGLWSAEIK